MAKKFEFYLTDENFADIMDVLGAAQKPNDTLAEDYIKIGKDTCLSKYYKTAYEYKRKAELIGDILKKLEEMGSKGDE